MSLYSEQARNCSPSCVSASGGYTYGMSFNFCICFAISIKQSLFPDEGYAMDQGWGLEAFPSSFSTHASPDPHAYWTPDTLAPIPSSSYPTTASEGFDSNTTHPATPTKRSAKAPVHRRDPSHIRRPRNAFFVFRSAFIAAQKQTGNGLQAEFSKQAARVWNAMSDDEKHEYQETARKEQLLHKIKHPDYQYAPRSCSRAKRTNKAARVVDAVPDLSLPSRGAESVPAIETSVPQLCTGDAKYDQPFFAADDLPHSLTFGADTFMFNNHRAQTTGYASAVVPNFFPPLHYTYTENYFATDLHAMMNDVSYVMPALFDYGLEN